jgi:death-on-curing protein
MREPKWLSPELAVAVHQMLLAEHGGGEGLRDRDLLESALARAKQKFSYGKGCTVCDLAAAISYGLAKNHPFVDGNKRVALTLGIVFLEINGSVFEAPEADAALTFELLAAGKMDEEELSQWYQLHCREA